MQRAKLVRSKCLPLIRTVVVLHFCISSVDLEAHTASKKMCQDNNRLLIMSSIMKWWRKNNITKPIECKYKNTKNYHEHEFVKFLARPEIKHFPCTSRNNSTSYYFKG